MTTEETIAAIAALAKTLPIDRATFHLGYERPAYDALRSVPGATTRASVWSGERYGAPYVLETAHLRIDDVRFEASWERKPTEEELAALPPSGEPEPPELPNRAADVTPAHERAA